MTQTGPEYITQCRKLGFSDQEIQAEMKKVHWLDADIHAAFAQVAAAPGKGKKGKMSKGPKIALIIVVGLFGLGLLAGIGAVAYINLVG